MISRAAINFNTGVTLLALALVDHFFFPVNLWVVGGTFVVIAIIQV